MTDYLPHLISVLAENGVDDWTVDRSHKHPQLKFVWRGRPMAFVFAGSPSDQRGVLNAMCSLRRLMGLKRVVHKGQARPWRRVARAEPIPQLATFEPRPDPFAVLAAWRGR